VFFEVSSFSARDAEKPGDFGSVVFVAEEVRVGDTWSGYPIIHAENLILGT
jgi:hypothetical protein